MHRNFSNTFLSISAGHMFVDGQKIKIGDVYTLQDVDGINFSDKLTAIQLSKSLDRPVSGHRMISFEFGKRIIGLDGIAKMASGNFNWSAPRATPHCQIELKNILVYGLGFIRFLRTNLGNTPLNPNDELSVGETIDVKTGEETFINKVFNGLSVTCQRYGQHPAEIRIAFNGRNASFSEIRHIVIPEWGKSTLLFN